MKAEQIKRLRELYENATPGTWDRDRIASSFVSLVGTSWWQCVRDATLIVEAIEALPALLSAVEENARAGWRPEPGEWSSEQFAHEWRDRAEKAESESRLLREALTTAMYELKAVVAWTRTEASPLREQEIKSVNGVIEKARAALSSSLRSPSDV